MKQGGKRYGIALKFRRFVLDPSAVPFYGAAESRLASKKYICQCSFVVQAGVAPLWQTPPVSFRRSGSAQVLSWALGQPSTAMIALDEHVLSQFNQRVLLLQVIEVHHHEGTDAEFTGSVVASGTLDPGVFLRKPPKDYAIKLEYNFVAVGKLFVNVAVDNLAAPLFTDVTELAARAAIKVEKITLEEACSPSSARGTRTSTAATSSGPHRSGSKRNPAAWGASPFTFGADSFLKVKLEEATTRTPSCTPDAHNVLRWDYTLPLHMDLQRISARGGRIKFILMHNSAQLSSFGVDTSVVASAAASGGGSFSVPITIGSRNSEDTVPAVFDFSVSRSEVLDLKPWVKKCKEVAVRASAAVRPASAPRDDASPQQEPSSAPPPSEARTRAAAAMANFSLSSRYGRRASNTEGEDGTFAAPSLRSARSNHSAKVGFCDAAAAPGSTKGLTGSHREGEERLCAPAAASGAPGGDPAAAAAAAAALKPEVTTLRAQLEREAEMRRAGEEEMHAWRRKFEDAQQELSELRRSTRDAKEEIKTLQQQNVQLMRQLERARLPGATTAPPSPSPHDPRGSIHSSGAASHSRRGQHSASTAPFTVSVATARPSPRQPPQTRSGMLFVGADEP